MSQQNVELVREIYALWSRGESARHLIDPKLEYVNPSYAVESGVQHSRSTLGKVREVYPDFRVEPERFVDAGENVVVIGVARGTSASGVKAQWRQGYVWTVRDGRAIRFRWFNQPAEALEAVGHNDQQADMEDDDPGHGRRGPR
jgi:ketosteroid isomerase-like protein